MKPFEDVEIKYISKLLYRVYSNDVTVQVYLSLSLPHPSNVFIYFEAVVTPLQRKFLPSRCSLPNGRSLFVLKNKLPFKLFGTAKPIGYRRPGHNFVFNAVNDVHLVPKKLCSLPG